MRNEKMNLPILTDPNLNTIGTERKGEILSPSLDKFSPQISTSARMQLQPNRRYARTAELVQTHLDRIRVRASMTRMDSIAKSVRTLCGLFTNTHSIIASNDNEVDAVGQILPAQIQ